MAPPVAVLIVEDYAPMRAALRQLLQLVVPACVVYEAADGADALALASRHRPRLVLMDVALPETDGIALTAQVRKALPDTRVIVVSQLQGSPYVERARQAGAFAYIAKEQASRELLPHVVRALDFAAVDTADGKALNG